MNRKLLLISSTLKYVIGSYRHRLIRFFVHLTPTLKSKNKLPFENPILWLGDLVIYTLDLILIPELHELILIISRGKYREANEEEKTIALEYFKHSINFDSIKVNTEMANGIKKFAHAFVTFNTINYSEQISKPIFVHELVHIWQYQRFGSVYIFRALIAQRSKAGYDYGGIEGLYTGMLEKKKFIDFNFEQQGEIFEDFCRLQQAPAGFKNSLVDATYQYYIDQVMT